MTRPINLGILLAGEKDPGLALDLPTYRQMFTALFAPASDQVEVSFIDSRLGEKPAYLDQFDAYLVSGSKYGVYDDEPWIASLLSFIRDAYQAGKPLVGVCFGHQALAEALGGRARKSPKGWGVGMHKMPVIGNLPFTDTLPKSFHLGFIHQDQVEALPPGAEAFMGDDFCPYAGFTIDGRVLAMQGHPEFPKCFLKALYDWLEDRIGTDRIAKARSSLENDAETDLVRGWIVSFLHHALSRRQNVA